LEDVTPAAPAQSEATPAPVLTAVESAVAKDDFTAYRETRRAERSGTPAPAPAAEPVTETKPEATAAPVEEPRTVSKRQHEINERIRLATERALADRDAEIARLRSQLPAPPAAPRTEPTAEKFPAYAQYLETNPDASLEDYIDARQDFRDGLKQKATAAQRAEADRTRSHQEGIAQAQARTLAARQADPVIDAKFKQWEAAQSVHELPEVLLLKTREQAIAAQQIPQAENDFASAVASSEYSAQIIAHIADHPDVLQKVRALENRTAVLKYFGKLETRFEKADAAPVQPKTISSAPTPGTALGSRPASAVDPVAAAVKANDVTAYRAARRAERASARR
jgi:hypothetical protein